MDESRDVSGEPGVLCAVLRLSREPVGEPCGDVRTVLERADLHLLRADGENHRIGLGQAPERIVGSAGSGDCGANRSLDSWIVQFRRFITDGGRNRSRNVSTFLPSSPS